MSKAEPLPDSKPLPPANPAPADTGRRIRFKIFGVGGAGCNTVNHIATARQGLTGVELIAINTDTQALEPASGVECMQIGATLTHGLGAGGDPEVGARAAQQDSARLAAAAESADIVFVTAGLGGGTGTGAAPLVARLAKEQGALVLAFVAIPFGFEGERRRQQALLGLEQLKAQADAVICIPNEKLFKIVGENASALEAFRKCDETIAAGVQAVWQLLARKGLINLDFATLRATLGGKHAEGIFSFGTGEGQQKAKDAVKAVQENPLFDGGQTLLKSEGLLVSILGGPDLTLADVQRTVEPLTRLAPRAHVIMGAAIEESYRGKLAVTVIASASSANSAAGRVKPVTTRPMIVEPILVRPGPTVPHPNVEAPALAPLGKRKEAPKEKQATLPLDNVTRGRFEATEPTLYNGENLDVPTFLRRGVNLKN